jgi:outer membrane protein OmpA-like peptidoglycan-associated protein
MSRVKIIIGGLLTSIFLIFLCISLHLEFYQKKLDLKKSKNNIKLEKKSSLENREKKVIKNIQITPIISLEKDNNLSLLSSEKNLFFTQENNSSENNISIEDIQIKISLLIKNEPIRFKKSSRRVDSKGKKTLHKVYNLIKNIDDLTIEIQGHTDRRGKEKLNQWISKKRADSVKEYLIKKGISSKNIQTKGFGESKPLFTDNLHHANNRRVEIYIKRR